MKIVVRYYGQEYDPALFRNGSWRGRWILFLARIIAWLETKVAWHVMHFIAKRWGLPKENVSHLEKMFGVDHKQLRRPIVQFGVDEPRESRYRAGRKNAGDGSYRGARTARAQEFFARYGETGRAGRYRYKRGQKFADPNGDVQEPPDGSGQA